MNLLRVLAVFSSLFVLVARLSATSLVPPTFSELVANAATIAQTEITATRCEVRNSVRGQIIVTVVRAKVLDAIKGAPGAEIEFEQLGGQVGDTRMVVEDLPQWNVGDRDYLFLRQLKGSVCPLVGMPHGRYPISGDGVPSLDQVARANHEPLTSADEVAQPLTKSARPRASGARALSSVEFRALVRTEIERKTASLK